jgi:hypothetical protein
MQTDDLNNLIDDAADTLRFVRCDVLATVGEDFDAPTDPDATSIWDLAPTPIPKISPRRRRQIRDTRENILRLREALAQGWDIAPELAHEESRLAFLETS